MKIVYIDAQNIHKSTQDIGWHIDWKLFFEYMKRKFEISEAKIIFGYVHKYRHLYESLRKIGYTVIFKETLLLPNGDIKGNVDIDIAIQTLLDLLEGELSSAYLVTGDGDYNTLVDLLKKRNKLGRVLIPHREKASKLLKKSAGPDVQVLEDIRYFIQKKDPTEVRSQ